MSGAVAMLHSSGKLIGVWDTPVIVVKKPSGKRTEYLPKEMVQILERQRKAGNPIHVCLELVNAMPGQGVRSMFSMGQGRGTWEGIIAALDLALEYVTPQTWKRALGLSGSDKAVSILRAQQLIPGAAPYLTRRKDEGRAEAILISEWARRRHQ